MKFGLSVAFLLLLVAGAVMVKGSGSDAVHENDAHLQRSKRGLRIYDLLRGNDASTIGPKPPKPTGRNDLGFRLEDALLPDAQTPNPAGERPSTDCQGNVVQKLGVVIKNQNEQLKMLMKLMADLNSKPMK